MTVAAQDDSSAAENGYSARLSRRQQQQGDLGLALGGGGQGDVPFPTAFQPADPKVAGNAALIAQFGAAIAQNAVMTIRQLLLGPGRLRIRNGSDRSASDDSSSDDGVGTRARGDLATAGAITFVDGSWDRGLYQLIDR